MKASHGLITPPPPRLMRERCTAGNKNCPATVRSIEARLMAHAYLPGGANRMATWFPSQGGEGATTASPSPPSPPTLLPLPPSCPCRCVPEHISLEKITPEAKNWMRRCETQGGEGYLAANPSLVSPEMNFEAKARSSAPKFPSASSYLACVDRAFLNKHLSNMGTARMLLCFYIEPGRQITGL
ncbi:hypothetical protein NDU88_001504 [Pleurodeles waltl]|uniref:Uncharacterized protein n=1 Tax=Pleurodeles waltl TaxID=8319 RepID=A0AAV7SCF9_PLEWA|nr:hypothetical protein NDU88_001504 [Pleurodeles waltl]